jgi:ubiquinol-cytochrome c reductase cytochrome c subunit
MLRVVVIAALAVAAASARAEDAASGQALYVAQGCYECHGGVGQGSSFSGPRLAPDVVPAEAFIVQLRQPAGDMPPYSDKVLSDRQIADIIAFLKTIPRPPAAASIPLLE